MKRVEAFLRQVVSWALGALFWRPWRRALLEHLRTARKVVLVRTDNRVGEVLLLTPLIDALKSTHEVHAVVHPKCARVLEGLPGLAGVHPFERRWLWTPFSAQLAALRALAEGAVVVNAANWSEYSGTVAITSRTLAPMSPMVAPAVGANLWLADAAVPALPGTDNEVEQRLHLLSVVLEAPKGKMCFRPPRSTPALDLFLATLGAPFAVVNPGGRLGERRVSPATFAAGCLALKDKGLTPVVTWGPGEEGLAQEVVAAAKGAVLAPPTTLDELAMLMARARGVLCNNTGPMHLSVAVGAPTLALFFRMPASRWGHHAPPHVMLEVTESDATARLVEAVPRWLAAIQGKPSA